MASDPLAPSPCRLSVLLPVIRLSFDVRVPLAAAYCFKLLDTWVLRPVGALLTTNNETVTIAMTTVSIKEQSMICDERDKDNNAVQPFFVFHLLFLLSSAMSATNKTVTIATTTATIKDQRR